jgi:hypothetical protein
MKEILWKLKYLVLVLKAAAAGMDPLDNIYCLDETLNTKIQRDLDLPRSPTAAVVLVYLRSL